MYPFLRTRMHFMHSIVTTLPTFFVIYPSGYILILFRFTPSYVIKNFLPKFSVSFSPLLFSFLFLFRLSSTTPLLSVNNDLSSEADLCGLSSVSRNEIMSTSYPECNEFFLLYPCLQLLLLSGTIFFNCFYFLFYTLPVTYFLLKYP